MKLKFKIQPYQTSAVESVVDCFVGQTSSSLISYHIDPGKQSSIVDSLGFKNTDIQLSDTQLIRNIQAVQQRQNLPISKSLDDFHLKDLKQETYTPATATYKKQVQAICRLHLDIEMETGTGKTYCYIKTIFELHRRYGWSKFIIVVPSIAIREGVYKSLEITAEHFMENYAKKARFFIYNSKELHHLESFSSDAGINIMIINVQAFNAAGKDNRRIYDELDDFQSRRPIDVISNNRPILILDEPQKMEGSKTLESLAKFKPLMVLRYSATHRTIHNKVYRLDALDAYNQKLVKKIGVRGITVKGIAGSNAYLYLESIEISTKAPVVRVEMEVRQKNGIKRIIKRLGKGKNLFNESNDLDQYRGFVIAEIDANRRTVEFTNGYVLSEGEAIGDVTETAIRRIQVREAIKAHFEKEKQLFVLGIKVLSLFFIDEVSKYRDYSQLDEKGEYARIFEEEYEKLKTEYLEEASFGNEAYWKYLTGIQGSCTHSGYFSIDKKTKKFIDPSFKIRGEEVGLSDDVEAYDLILRDKERLLSFTEPVRFIFSHSALREGWDNPNVFVMCMLKHSDNMISRRQEVGRGLRLSVNQYGERMDDPAIVHEINVLTVIASESYKDFVANLQREMKESLSARPRKADKNYFIEKVIHTVDGVLEKISSTQAEDIEFYLIQNRYVDRNRQLTSIYHEAKTNQTLAALPADLALYADQIFALIDSIFDESQLPDIGDDRKQKINPLNVNFEKKEFKELWNRINRKATYRVEFESNELIQNSIQTINKQLHVTPFVYIIEKGEQSDQVNYDQLSAGNTFQIQEISAPPEYKKNTGHSLVVKYDLIGKITGETYLTRETVAKILCGLKSTAFQQFKQNPEDFIREVSRLINEQKATIIIERLSYNSLAETFDVNIFTAGQSKQDFDKAVKLKKHIYDYVITDSENEKNFVNCLDNSAEVVVYAKLPRGFLIPTPVGDYNPDWAISFKEGSVKHIYFVAETKGSISTMQFRVMEDKKIECARKFFEEINRKIAPKNIRYDVVDSYEKLMEVVGIGETTI